MEKIIVDTDIGSDIDDALCFAYLLCQPECELVGITTCSSEPKKRAEIALKYGFSDVSSKRYYQTRTYTTEEFLAYLATDEDHLQMSETKREAFFNEIRKTLNHYGGTVKLYDTIDLQIAKKP